jgi:cobalt-zinc-cadmium efflux system protein
VSGRLSVVLVLDLVLAGGLLVVGVSARSLGVLAEGADYAAEAGAIVVSLLAIRLSSLPPTHKRPQGYPRATIWAAAVNAGWMLVLCVLIVIGGIERVVAGTQEVQGLPVLIVSGIAAVVMFAGALVLGGDADEDGDHPDGDLNMRAVLLDTAGDAAAAAASLSPVASYLLPVACTGLIR